MEEREDFIIIFDMISTGIKPIGLVEKELLTEYCEKYFLTENNTYEVTDSVIKGYCSKSTHHLIFYYLYGILSEQKQFDDMNIEDIRTKIFNNLVSKVKKQRTEFTKKLNR